MRSPTRCATSTELKRRTPNREKNCLNTEQRHGTKTRAQRYQATVFIGHAARRTGRGDPPRGGLPVVGWALRIGRAPERVRHCQPVEAARRENEPDLWRD